MANNEKERSNFIEKLKQEFGERLRVVATYDSESYDALYIRDDIDDMYTEKERQEIYEERILGGLSKEYMESLYHSGNLNGVVEVYDEAVIFHFPRDNTSGLHISIDSDMDLHVMSLVEIVQEDVERLFVE